MTATIPTNSEELAELLSDDAKAAEIFAEEGTRLEFLKAFEEISNKGGRLSDQISAEVAATITEQMREWGVDERPDLTELSNSVVSSIHKAGLAEQPVSVYNPKAAGAKVDDVVADASEFFTAIWHRNVSPEAQEIKNTLSSGCGSEGGFLVPERLRSTLLQTSLESSVVRPRAMVVPMDSLRVPFPAIDDTSHASSVFGGIIGYWTEEAATITQSDPSFRQVVLDANKLTAYTQVPNELMADSVISFSAFINQVFPQALAWWEDLAFMKGTGVGEPLGVLHSDNSAKISVAKESGQAASTIVWENVVKMYARMLPGSLNSAVWVVSPDTFPQLATMALSVGTGGSAVYISSGVGSPPTTILGRPVIVSEKAYSLGSLGDINFIDFGFYLLGDRQNMTAESSTDFKFQSDQTAFKIIERVDGRPWLASAITPQNAGDTLSPYVQLAARA